MLDLSEFELTAMNSKVCASREILMLFFFFVFFFFLLFFFAYNYFAIAIARFHDHFAMSLENWRIMAYTFCHAPISTTS